MRYLRTLLNLSILLPLFAVLITGLFVINAIEQHMREDLRSRLVATVNTNKTTLKFWIGQEQSRLAAIAHESQWLSDDAGHRMQALDAHRAVQKYLGLALLNDRGQLQQFSAMTPVIATESPWLKSALGGRNVAQVVQLAQGHSHHISHALLLASPIRSSDERVRGVLLALRDLTQEFSTTLAVSRVGDSGESYAFGPDGGMYSESRFPEQLRHMGLIAGKSAIMQVYLRDPGIDLTRGQKPSRAYTSWPLNEMAKSAIAGFDGVNVDGYRDYRGVMVAGAWTWLADMQMGLVSEIDIAEAYATISLVKRSLMVLLTLLSLFASIAWFFFAQQRKQNAAVQHANEQLIAEMAQRREVETQLRDVIEQAPNAMLMADRQGKMILVNRECERLFGYTRDEMIGQDIEMLVPLTARFRHREHREWFFFERKPRLMGEGRELLGVRKDGHSIVVEVGLNSLLSQGQLCVLATISDVSDRREFIQKLQQAREAAEQATQAKSQFLANMSHEIRTPLNAVLGYAQILERESNFTANQKKQISAMRSAGMHLLGLINSILDLSKIEAGHMELHIAPFDLHAIVNTLNDMFLVKCQQKGIGWHLTTALPERCVLMGDQQKISQIVINVVGNAVKFTQEGDVRVAIERLGGTVSVDVLDDGPGIAEADLARVFEAFTQTDAGRKQGGTGLGLAISKSLVEMMGGDLQLSNAPPHGCRVALALPLPDASVSAFFADAENDLNWHLAEGTDACIAVIDDNQDNRDVLGAMLLNMGFRVVTANDGDQAIQLIAEHNPCMVFMDIRMPRVNGIDALRQIRSLPENVALVVVAVSASSMTLHREHFIDVGFNDFIAKPFAHRDIVACLREWLTLPLQCERSAPNAVPMEEGDALELHVDSAWLHNMREAASLGQLTRAQRLLQHLSPAQHTPATLHYLQRLVNEFRWEELLKQLPESSGE